MRQVRVSRDEARRTRSALEEQTRRRHRTATARKTATFCDLPSLVRQVVGGERIDPDAALEVLYREFYYGGVDEADFASAIFNPALTDLTRLPLGVLDQKEELLPASQLPSSFEALRDLAERMISVSRDHPLIETVALGWPGQGDGRSRLARHLYELWQMHDQHPPLYRAMVTGRHRFVIQALRDARYPGMTKIAASAMQDHAVQAHIGRVLECQALLWSAHDVQMVVARNAKATSNPLGELLSSDKTVVEPATALGAAREWHAALVLIIDTYRATGLGSEAAGPDSMVAAGDPVVRRLRSQIEQEAKRGGIDLNRAARHIDLLMDGIARRLDGTNDPFIQTLAAPRAAYQGPKSFSAVWFSGLSPLAASGVAVLRYLQAETQIAALIEEHLPVAGLRPAARSGVALPAFDVATMRRGWKTRSRDLLHAWRGAVLSDKDLHSQSTPDEGRAKNVGKLPMDAATAFLSRAGERRIGDDHGALHDDRRNLYMLDVIPEHRLCS